MPKKYILDSSVVLSDPNCIYNFNRSDVLIPLVVIEEIENFKNKSDLLGKNARTFCRMLDELRSRGSLAQGIPTEKGGSIRVAFSSEELVNKLPHEFNRSMADNCILAITLEFNGVIVTNDVNLRVKADSLGLNAEGYEAGRVESSDLYDGHAEVVISGEQMAELFSGGFELDGYYENQFLTLYTESNLNHTALGIVKSGVVHPLSKDATVGVSKIHPQNREQICALHLLLDDSIPLVTLSGRSGCGKSLLTLAAGLAKVQEGVYNRMLVSKPTVSMGGSKNDLGWLPGELRSKLDPWLGPIKDSLEIICGVDSTRNKSKRTMFDDLEDQGLIQAEGLSFLRGRSLQKQFFWIDEASNISIAEAKAIITRIGNGSKLIFSGDPEQIDSAYLDSENNGLSIVIDRFKSSPLAGHITLQKGVRSALSEEASRIL